MRGFRDIMCGAPGRTIVQGEADEGNKNRPQNNDQILSFLNFSEREMCKRLVEVTVF